MTDAQKTNIVRNDGKLFEQIYNFASVNQNLATDCLTKLNDLLSMRCAAQDIEGIFAEKTRAYPMPAYPKPKPKPLPDYVGGNLPQIFNAEGPITRVGKKDYDGVASAKNAYSRWTHFDIRNQKLGSTRRAADEFLSRQPL